jgi:hypothetical protein
VVVLANAVTGKPDVAVAEMVCAAPPKVSVGNVPKPMVWFALAITILDPVEAVADA